MPSSNGDADRSDSHRAKRCDAKLASLERDCRDGVLSIVGCLRIAYQFSSFFKQTAHLLSLLKGDFGIGPVFEGVLIFFWGPNALGAAMHATALLATNRRRLTAATDTRPRSAARTLEHGDGISNVGTTSFGHRFRLLYGFSPRLRCLLWLGRQTRP